MYFRRKTSAGRAYLQIVESRREGAAVRQQVIATLGRIEDLQESGQLERLLRSGARFADKAIVLDALDRGEATVVSTRRIGPALAFERVWEETGCRGVIERLASKRGHEFSLERAAFLTMLHRLFGGGSDRAADCWREDYRIDGVEGLELHHLYRAMAWLGEELPENEQDGATPFARRCVKDVLEEELFACRRDLLTTLDVVFMDTTSLYFEGAGGQTLGQRGFSKDHRPDLNQMILAVLLDGDGRPVCTEMWPGNTADVGSLIPAIDRLQRRFRINRVCVPGSKSPGTCRSRHDQRRDDRRTRSAKAALCAGRARAHRQAGARTRARRSRPIRSLRSHEARRRGRLRGQGGRARRPALHRLPQSRSDEERRSRPRRDRRRAGAAVAERREKPGRQQGFSPLPRQPTRRWLFHRPRQGRGGRQIRRRVRAADQCLAVAVGSDARLQTIVDRGAGVPNHEKSVRDAADLSQARRDDPRPCRLQLPGAGAEEGVGRPPRRREQWRSRVVAQRHRRSRLAH